MKALKFGKLPFETLHIAYFKVFDQELDPLPFFDSNEEQILKLLSKKFHETVVILRIERVEVLNVITTVPQKRKLDVSELKSSVSLEEREKIASKIKEMRDKYQ